MKEAEEAVDPLLHIDEPMWAVYGADCFPSIICCKVLNHPTCGPTIWGYSIYRRQAGFRTLGMTLSVWAQSNDAQFFDHQEKAHCYLRLLLTPKEGT